MHGPVARMIQSQGREYGVYNADGGGGRSVPSYGDEAETTLIGSLESRGMPQTATDSDGTEVETDLEIRSVPDDDIDIRPAGSNDGYPTKLEHPSGRTYRVLDTVPEDGSVTVLTVVED